MNSSTPNYCAVAGAAFIQSDSLLLEIKERKRKKKKKHKMGVGGGIGGGGGIWIIHFGL